MRRYLIILSFFPLLTFARGIKSDSIENQTVVDLAVCADFKKSLPHHFGIEIREDIQSRLYFQSTVHPNIPEGVSVMQKSREYSIPAYFKASQTLVHFSYKPVQYLTLGVAYRLDLLGDKGWKDPKKFMRHNVQIGLTAQYRYNQWKFAFRERLDMHFRTDSVNPDEKNAMDLMLRHRLSASYTMRSKPLRYILGFELINTLNRPTDYLNANRTYITYRDDYGKQVQTPEFGQYIASLRPSFGIEWRLDKRNSLEFVYTFKYNTKLDTNITHIPQNKPLKGGNLELTRIERMAHSFTIAYVFSH